MKVYIKKDKALKLLGEGKVYSKKDLILKEQDDNKLVADASSNDESFGGVSNAEKAIDTTLQKNPTADAASTDMASLGPKQNVGNGQGVVIRTNQVDFEKNRGAFSNMAQRMPNAELQVDRGDGVQPLVAHKTPRKVMDEMRENSVPFTKSELTEFLKSL